MIERKNMLSYYRKLQGLTQKDLASVLGVSVNTISSWENGIFFPTGRHLFVLTIIFDVYSSDLFPCEWAEGYVIAKKM